MKTLPISRRIHLILTAILLLTITAVPARSQPVPGSIEVGASVGRFYGGSFPAGSTRFFDAKVDVDDDIQSGFWLSGQLSRVWSLEVAVRRTETRIVEHTSGGVFPHEPELAGLDVASIEILAIRSFPVRHFVPYVGIGAGLVNLDINTPDRSDRDSNRAAIALAAGAKYYATSWLGFRFDVRSRTTYLGQRNERDHHRSDDRSQWFSDQEVAAGVFAAFGLRN